MGKASSISVLTSFVYVLVSLPYALTQSLVVETDKGFVKGKRLQVHHSKQVDVFYGIPYAKPPLGRYRFRHPQPNDPWEGVLDATTKPNACMQGFDVVFPGFNGSNQWNPNTPPSEDCLYLNVWRPVSKSHDSGPKAVMVWIYGGSFLSGSSALDVYDAKYLAAEEDVVIVSLQYRVGSLGFLSFDHLDAPGNAGVMDQSMALDWVRRNAHRFGGDNYNITLFGESSGAASIGMHLLSPLSRSKFDRAILQSGGPTAPWATLTQAESTRRSHVFAAAMNCTRNTLPETLLCLRDRPAEDFPTKEYDPDIVRGISQFPFVPVIDGIFLTESPENAFRRQNFKKIPVLVGSNSNEGTWLLPYYNKDLFTLKQESNIKRRQFVMAIDDMFNYYPQFPKKINSFGKDAILFQYTPWKDPSSKSMNRDRIEQAIGDVNFICPVVELAQTYAMANMTVYYYEFAHRSSRQFWPNWMGVMHGDEIFFAFGDPLVNYKNYSNHEKRLSKKMMKYWANFAKTGDPNQEPNNAHLNEWPIHTHTERKYLRLDTHLVNNLDNSQSVRSGPRIKQCAFWREYLPKLVTATADMTELEKQWKVQFSEWSTKYIVDWKNQFDNFRRDYEQRNEECDRH
ncbi:acetylcholinesterase-like isoform X1 [Argopecten irradians]|uniref:acetylcholinesterase-like isoform X1 n=1 Tax=Argopecten irradians TaxID=31199 RepID=UPI003714C34F